MSANKPKLGGGMLGVSDFLKENVPLAAFGLKYAEVDNRYFVYLIGVTK